MGEEIVDRATVWECPWLAVERKTVDLGSPRGREEFYSARTPDYVTVLAVTDDARVPLVRIFRPAVEELSLELPAGVVDPGEAPAEAARRELLEETGVGDGELVELGSFWVDTGRMETRAWAYLVLGGRVVAAPSSPDEQLELVFVGVESLGGLVARGELRHAGHAGVLAAAAARGYLDLAP